MSTQSKILAPHKEQDGWRYVRVTSDFVTDNAEFIDADYANEESELIRTADNYEEYACWYNDNAEGSRVISSRRVEEAVETADYLKLCYANGLNAIYVPNPYGDFWMVGGSVHGSWAGGFMIKCGNKEGCTPEGMVEPLVSKYACYAPTLREAYWRYKNSVAAND